MSMHNVTSIKSRLNSTHRSRSDSDGKKFYWRILTFCDEKGNTFRIDAISDNVENLNIINE